MASASLVDGTDILEEEPIVGTEVASHGSLLDDEREADLGLEADTGMMGELSGGGDDAVSLIYENK